MEINKENFTKALIEHTHTQLFEKYKNNLELGGDAIEYFTESFLPKISEYLTDCIHYLYINGEYAVLKNSYKVVKDRMNYNDILLNENDNFENISTEEYTLNHFKLMAIENNAILSTLREELEKLSDVVSPVQIDLNTSDVSRHQQVLVFHYLFDSLNLNADNTKLAELIEFAINKTSKDIRNSNIYKILKEPFSYFKNNSDTSQLITNLNRAREYFEGIEATSIIERIDRDINIYTKKRKI